MKPFSANRKTTGKIYLAGFLLLAAAVLLSLFSGSRDVRTKDLVRAAASGFSQASAVSAGKSEDQAASTDHKDGESADKSSQSGDGQSGDGQNGDDQNGDDRSGDGRSGDGQNGDGQSGDSQSGQSQDKEMRKAQRRLRLARVIFFQVRVPRVLAVIFCGIGLALSGLLLQVSLNNTLLAPGIIGINSGAGMFVLISGILFPGMALSRSIFSFAGAFLAAMIVCGIALRAGISKTTLILAGVAVSYLFTAGTDMIITFRPESVADKVGFSLGGFSSVSSVSLLFAIPLFIAGIMLTLILAPGVDLFLLGDEAAEGLGLPVRRWRFLCILASTLLAGASVSLCGLLGFVGLIIPNFVRMVSGSRFKVNMALSVLYGPAFLLFCDLIARQLFYPYELPAGLILSVIGVPFFLSVLLKRKKRLDL